MIDTLLPKNDEEFKDTITSIIYGADWKKSDIADAHKPDVEAVMQLVHARDTKMLEQARLKGAIDCSTFIMQHDESSFRQERAWFKIKPGLLLKYQADLMAKIAEGKSK